MSSNTISHPQLISKKLVLVGPLPPPSGGMANQTKQLIQLLTDAGIEVRLVQVNAPYSPAWIGKIRVVRALFRLIPYKLKLWKACKNADLMHIMANSGWSWHLFAAPAIIMGKLRGVKVIVNYRGGEAATFFETDYRWVKPILNKADQVIVPSGFLEAVFLKRDIQPALVSNIINLERFSPADDQQNLAQLQTAPHFIVTRNLEPIYDIPTALKAFAIVFKVHPKATMTVAGSGPELENLKQLSQDLGIESAVYFSGRIPNEELPKIYQKSQIMFNPTTKDNMPISMLESLASGIPCISTNAGGIPYLVQDGVNAKLCDIGDAEKMGEIALNLIANENQYQMLRDNGLKMIKGFTWPEVSQKLFKVYLDVLNINNPL